MPFDRGDIVPRKGSERQSTAAEGKALGYAASVTVTDPAEGDDLGTVAGEEAATQVAR